MLYRKPANLKYTDLCIYVDKHLPEILVPGENPVLEDTIYNYIWLVLKALAIKKRMFTKYEDYDGYCYYGASRLFLAFRKKLQNQGKIVHGKEIAPLKSCLNYMKAIMYPMKVEYLNRTYAQDMYVEKMNGTFDEFKYGETLKQYISADQGADDAFITALHDLCERLPTIINNTLKETSYTTERLDQEYLRISIYLSLKNSLSSKTLLKDDSNVVLWKLPASSKSFVENIINLVKANLKTEILDCYSYSRIDSGILDTLAANPEGEFIDHVSDFK